MEGGELWWCVWGEGWLAKKEGDDEGRFSPPNPHTLTASRVAAACPLPFSVSTDSLDEPWTRPSAFQVDWPCRTSTIDAGRAAEAGGRTGDAAQRGTEAPRGRGRADGAGMAFVFNGEL